jgi:opacity protein-like surface antigen
MKAVLTALTVAAFALIGGILISGPSKAAGFGCQGTIIGGMAATKTDTAIDANLFGPTANVANLNGLGSNGSLVGLGMGCDWQVDKFVLGAFGDYVWHNGQESNINVTLFGPSLGATMGFDRQWTLGGRGGFMVTDTTLVYALLGWTKLSSSGISGIVSADVPDFTGVVLGGGIETTISKHIKLGFEYRHTAFDSQTVSLMIPGAPPGFVLTSRMTPEMDTAMVRLSIGTGFFGAATSSTK